MYLRGGEQGGERVRKEGAGTRDEEMGDWGLELLRDGIAVLVGKHSFKWIHVLMIVV